MAHGKNEAEAPVKHESAVEVAADKPKATKKEAPKPRGTKVRVTGRYRQEGSTGKVRVSSEGRTADLPGNGSPVEVSKAKAAVLVKTPAVELAE